jgi:uncharacterized membrane protein
MARPGSRTELSLEILSLVLLIAMFAMLAIHWSQFPESVPAHFGISGEPNGFHGKGFLLILPGMAAVVWIVLTVAERHQGLINIPFAVDRDSPDVQSVLRSMMIVEKAVVTLVFAWLTAAVVRTALGRAHGLGPAFLPIVLTAILLPLVAYSVKLRRLGK